MSLFLLSLLFHKNVVPKNHFKTLIRSSANYYRSFLPWWGLKVWAWILVEWRIDVVNNEVLDVTFWSVSWSFHGERIITDRESKRNSLSFSPAVLVRWLDQNGNSVLSWLGMAFENWFGQIFECESAISKLTVLLPALYPQFFISCPLFGCKLGSSDETEFCQCW